MKKNIVKAKCISGIYADKDIEVHIAPNSKDCKVIVGKIEISSKVLSVHIHMRAGKMTEMNLILVKSE